MYKFRLSQVYFPRAKALVGTCTLIIFDIRRWNSWTPTTIQHTCAFSALKILIYEQNITFPWNLKKVKRSISPSSTKSTLLLSNEIYYPAPLPDDILQIVIIHFACRYINIVDARPMPISATMCYVARTDKIGTAIIILFIYLFINVWKAEGQCLVNKIKIT